MPNQYQYQPLEDNRTIRLLHASRSKNGSLLFDFSHVSLNNSPVYEAVSYTWGSKDRDKTIRHRKTGHVLYMTSNCQDMLWSLTKDGPRILWVDALSINQEGILEKNHQIPLMADLYRSASRTIAYIGEADSSSYDLSRMHISKALDPTLDIKRSAAMILSRPWFTRTWVIQEVLLSKRLVIQAGKNRIEETALASQVTSGGGVLNMKEIFPADLRRLRKQRVSGNREHRSMGMLRTDAEESKRSQTTGARTSGSDTLTNSIHLFNVLCESASYQCEDPRDKLFAIISLLEGDIPPDLEANYSRSVEEVYTNISRHLLSHGATKALAAAIGIELANRRHLPSWTIDWRCLRHLSQPGYIQSAFCPGSDASRWYSASDHSNTSFERIADKALLTPLEGCGLCIRGKRFHTVEQPKIVSALAEWESRPNFWARKKYCEKFSAPMDMYPEYAIMDKGNTATWLKRISGFDWRLGCVDERSSLYQDWKTEPDQLTRREMNKDKRVCVIQNGNESGYAPWTTATSDIICVFLGFELPFVLRPCKKAWYLVGECYIPWVMEGQGVADIDWAAAYDREPVAPLEDFHIY
ncbi:hypothetical protein BT63DRAFT_263718 [Microthyrium microscopicum]|uniref:Heterokaryon incompatibility domain-containing protein n=1 Tax=Microthyrium microscopicum TaxID=703497 RepID=A0A6A6UD24_9PEZI|nr:hypothetical protein BT63DRAFT_263718 [Microthyrium microscopicum]